MKLKDLYENYELKQNEIKTKEYEYIETKNYIFLKLDEPQFYILYDDGELTIEECNYYLNNMIVPKNINKDNLINFFVYHREYFNRLIISGEQDKYNFNNLKKIFSRNYMGYSDWDICTSDIDLEYEMSNITFNNLQHFEHCTMHQFNQLIVSPPTRMASSNLKIIGNKYTFFNQSTSSYSSHALNIQFITRRK